MSKSATPRRLADTEAKAVLRGLKGSQYKAALVMGLIRGKKVEQALADLQFSPKSMAVSARKLLMSAIANAENNHQLNVDQLYVKEAFADKGQVLKRFMPRARGRAASILKHNCHMTVVVAEKAIAEKQDIKAEGKGK
ncbi:MAG: 50S ribosomal protein L22 [Alphaproteobacteria bacterium]